MSTAKFWPISASRRACRGAFGEENRVGVGQAPPFPESVQVCKFFQMTFALARAAKTFNLERALNAECGMRSAE